MRFLCLGLALLTSASASAQQTPAEIYRAFLKDKEICWAFIVRLDSDPDTVTAFDAALVHGSGREWEGVLRESSLANSEEFRYVLANAKYFGFGVNYHSTEGADAARGPLLCARTQERLKDIETLPVSNEAWRMRVFYLDRMLKGLDHPGNEGPDSGGHFYDFKLEVDLAAKLYAQTRPESFRRWVNRAVMEINRMRLNIVDGSAGLSKAEQNKTLDEWVAYLRGTTAQAKGSLRSKSK